MADSDDDPMVVLAVPPKPGKRATDLHVWIATFANGDESVLPTDLPMFPDIPNRSGAVWHVPLMNSDRKAAEGFEAVAQKCRKASMHLGSNQRIINVRLGSGSV